MQSRLKTRAAIAVCCAALATIPLGAFAARAHVQTYQANVTIHYDHKAQALNGHVGTSSFCHEGRTVSVFRTDTGGQLVGTVVSDHSGQWGPIAAPGPGTYEARVAEIHEGGYGHDHLCLAGSSGPISAS